MEDLRLVLGFANEIDYFTRCGNLYWIDGYANSNGASFRQSYHLGGEEEQSDRCVATFASDEGGRGSSYLTVQQMSADYTADCLANLVQLSQRHI